MSEYVVRTYVEDGDSRTASTRVVARVEASKFEIEDGVLVFYEQQNMAGTMGDMLNDDKIVAVNNWDKVERR